MAKAHFKRPDGTSIVIEGNPQEVAALISMMESGTSRKEKALIKPEKRRKS